MSQRVSEAHGGLPHTLASPWEATCGLGTNHGSGHSPARRDPPPILARDPVSIERHAINTTSRQCSEWAKQLDCLDLNPVSPLVGSVILDIHSGSFCDSASLSVKMGIIIVATSQSQHEE